MKLECYYHLWLYSRRGDVAGGLGGVCNKSAAKSTTLCVGERDQSKSGNHVHKIDGPVWAVRAVTAHRPRTISCTQSKRTRLQNVVRITRLMANSAIFQILLFTNSSLLLQFGSPVLINCNCVSDCDCANDCDFSHSSLTCREQTWKQWEIILCLLWGVASIAPINLTPSKPHGFTQTCCQQIRCSL